MQIKKYILSTIIIFSLSVGLIFGLNASVWGQGSVLETGTLSLSAYVNQDSLLTPTSPSINQTIALDGTEEVSFHFGSTSKNLSITLTGPGGQQISLGDPATDHAQNYIISDPTTIGASYIFGLKNPEPGLWSYQVQSLVPLNHPRAVFLTIFTSSPIRTGLIGGGRDYRVDDNITLGVVTVEDTSILQEVSITAEVTNNEDPNFISPPLTFRDDGLEGDSTAGDGLFTTVFSLTTPGDYHVSALIEGSSSQGQAFQRSTYTSFKVHPVYANLLGTFTDRGIDLDSDDSLDQLGLALDVEVLTAGEYNLVVWLAASNGEEIARNHILDLSVGTAAPEVIFPTEKVQNVLGVDGPYQVRKAILEYLDAPSAPVVDRAYNLGQTATYALGNMARRPIEPALHHLRVTPVDSDQNGLYNYLDVTLPLDFLNPSFYSQSARLWDAKGHTLAQSSRSDYFQAGLTTITLRFDGSRIGENGVDGPYQVRHLTIFGAGEQLSLKNLLNIEGFRANQFEGFVPSFREQYGLVVMEAENASQVSPRNGKNWLAQTGLTDYTGTGYLKASPDIGTLSASTDAETGAELQYSFYINTPGTYYLWLRGYAPDGAGDSVYVGLGENSVSGGQLLAGNSYLTGFPPRRWAWANRGVWQQAGQNQTGPIVLTLDEVGRYTLYLWLREDGLNLDRIILTTDETYRPTGQGPTESAVLN